MKNNKIEVLGFNKFFSFMDVPQETDDPEKPSIKNFTWAFKKRQEANKDYPRRQAEEEKQVKEILKNIFAIALKILLLPDKKRKKELKNSLDGVIEFLYKNYKGNLASNMFSVKAQIVEKLKEIDNIYFPLHVEKDKFLEATRKLNEKFVTDDALAVFRDYLLKNNLVNSDGSLVDIETRVNINDLANDNVEVSAEPLKIEENSGENLLISIDDKSSDKEEDTQVNVPTTDNQDSDTDADAIDICAEAKITEEFKQTRSNANDNHLLKEFLTSVINKKQTKNYFVDGDSETDDKTNAFKYKTKYYDITDDSKVFYTGEANVIGEQITAKDNNLTVNHKKDIPVHQSTFENSFIAICKNMNRQLEEKGPNAAFMFTLDAKTPEFIDGIAEVLGKYNNESIAKLDKELRELQNSGAKNSDINKKQKELDEAKLIVSRIGLFKIAGETIPRDLVLSQPADKIKSSLIDLWNRGQGGSQVVSSTSQQSQSR